MIRLIVRLCIWVVLVLVLAAMMLLLASNDIRFRAFRLAAELPGGAYYLMVRKDVVSRDFGRAAAVLDDQLDFSLSIYSGQSHLLPGLLQNTRYVVERARFSNDFAKLAPYLQRFSKQYPKLFQGQLWTARAMLASDPAAAMRYAEAAIRMVPGDHRPYRIAIQAALRLNMPQDVSRLCGIYREAQFGDTHPYHYNPLFSGQSMRGLILEVTDENGDVVLAGNKGLRLAEGITYEFPLPRPAAIRSLRLLVSTMPGVTFRLDQLVLVRDSRATEVLRTDYLIISGEGFFTLRGNIVNASDEGDDISLLPRAGSFATADTVRIMATFARLPIVSDPECAAK
jgi:hypothetical protein